MKKFLAVLGMIFVFPNSVRALTCGDGCTLRDETTKGIYCSCPASTDWNYQHGCSSHQYYDPRNGLCVECDPTKYSCFLDYYNETMSGYSAVPCSSVVDGCMTCNGERTCYQCYRGFTLVNGACVKTPTCTSGQYVGSDGSCGQCSDIPISNGTCLSCSSSTQCDNISCDSGYVWMGGQTCAKAATCTYPLKEVADYSGECVGCCTD